MSDETEMLCTWPNGERREVMVMSHCDGVAHIIWNERVDTNCAAVTGFDDNVPIEWLSQIEARQ